jgi:hypothetical protein
MEMKRYAKRSHIQTRLPTVLTATEIKVRLTLLMLFNTLLFVITNEDELPLHTAFL